ncbi:hypothetical protein HQN89_26935 [Paenibacillus frigoriresistens]|uniref:stalk domain-containing protein n=1 Tax=Paenibacillus alginolyticus TaxID=59839 RepID=UPI001562F55A|nr:stalk domain-containing protein [Paenibacillus frigoriresistens]NRF94546.1 hypothetical protein [Paenibacillus frigoriresistens]
MKKCTTLLQYFLCTAILAATYTIFPLATYASFEKKGSVLVPIRTAAEQLNAKVDWNDLSRSVILLKGSHRLEVTIGSREATLDGKLVDLQNPVQLADSRTVVPLSLLTNFFGINGVWNENEDKLMVLSKPLGVPMDYKAQGVVNKNRAAYNLQLNLNENGELIVQASISVDNLSEDSWIKIVFYMIPNVFTEENKSKLAHPEDYAEDSAQFDMQEVLVNGQKAEFQLSMDTLSIPLKDTLNPKQNAQVSISYKMKLSKVGNRIAWDGKDTYYLAQWYPMLATYQGGGWNKADYYPIGESYHTTPSDFKLHYELPTGYSLISSSDSDLRQGISSGDIEVAQVKELFAMIYKEKKMESRIVDGVELRVFQDMNDESDIQKAVTTAADAVQYFQQTFGKYPLKQLDIVMGSGTMEYPGIVTVSSLSAIGEHFYQTLVHEIAHQWWYAVVSNDPFRESWLDEGITQLSTFLFLYDQRGELEHPGMDKAQAKLVSLRQAGTPLYSNRLLTEDERTFPLACYSQPTLKLWDLFNHFGGMNTAKTFLGSYYDHYSFKQVNTKEFVKFTEAYFLVDDEFFKEWLNLNKVE